MAQDDAGGAPRERPRARPRGGQRRWSHRSPLLRRHGWRRLPTAAQVLLATAVGTALQVLLSLLPWTRGAATTASLVIALAFVGVLAVASARRPDRGTWLLLTTGLSVLLVVRIAGAAASGSLASPAMPLTAYRDHPVVLVLALAGYLLVFGGQFRIVRESLEGVAASAWLDALTAFLLVVSVAVALVVPVLAADGVPELGALALVSRPLGSGLLVVLCVAAAVVRGRRRDRRVDALAAGSATFFAGDLVSVLCTVGALPPSPLVTVVLGALRLAPLGLLTASALAPAPARVVLVSPRRTLALVSSSVLLGASAVLAADHALGLPDLTVVLALACVLSAGVRLLALTEEVRGLLGSRQLALVDDLTDLLNRRGLGAEVARALQAPRGSTGAEGDDGVCLLLVDLDAFKEVNDHHGQATGDLVLQEVAHRLRGLTTGRLALARPGGDEFALLAPDADEAAGAELASRVAAVLAAPIAAGGHLVRLGTSIGVAHVAAGSAPEELLRRAALALHGAQSAGGAVQWFDEAVDAAARHRARLLDDLRAALAEQPRPGAAGQLVAHYQPQVDADGGISGVEALARWEHPELGLLQPSAFIDLAEEHGLLPAITERVLHQAVAAAAGWRREGHELRVAVNLSASCLDWAPLLDVVDAVLATRALPPELLVLEVTETGLVSEAAHGLEVAAQLVARGVELSIDDYGTGYSSLAHLDHLPASELKLDRAFTVRLLEDPRTALIVRATVDLAHDLGMRLVAEGVEDEATHRALTEIGCDVTQGYWHSRPVPAGQLSAWLSQRSRPARPALA